MTTTYCESTNLDKAYLARCYPLAIAAATPPAIAFFKQRFTDK
ncbi:hypothetical protein [Nostoc sp. FACHB-133]|nr:hypothetical protein [Nostoc sp. FACHB-133]